MCEVAQERLRFLLTESADSAYDLVFAGRGVENKVWRWHFGRVSNRFESLITLSVEVEVDMVDVFYTLFRPGVCAVLNGVHSHEYVTATGTLTREPRLKRGTCEGKVRPATTMATSERPRAMVLVKACCSTLTAFSHGEVPVWPKAEAARNRATKPCVKNRKRTDDEWKRLQQDMFMGRPPQQLQEST